VCVGGYDVNLGTGLLESSIVFGCVFNFCRAVEGESGWHENEDVPLAFEAGFCNFNELAIVESLVFEGLNLCVDE
jgi:hypothetical protein